MTIVRRILMATINYDHPQRGMIHAFEAVFGRQAVLHYDYLERCRSAGSGPARVNEEFLEHALTFRPDWCWLQLQNTDVIWAETLRRVREALPWCVLTHWTGDVRAEIGGYLASVSTATHMTFTAASGQLALYKAAGAPKAIYLPHGLDWEEDVLGLPEWEPTFRVPHVVFIANNYGSSLPGTAEREGSVRALVEAGIDAGVVGAGWESTGLPVAGRCAVKQQVHVYRRAKVALSVNHFPGMPGYHGDRQLVGMASGTPVLARRFPLMDVEFSDGVNVVVFENSDDLVSKARELLSSPELRARIGREGRAEAIRKHSWLSRILYVLPWIEREAAALRAGTSCLEDARCDMESR